MKQTLKRKTYFNVGAVSSAVPVGVIHIAEPALLEAVPLFAPRHGQDTGGP